MKTRRIDIRISPDEKQLLKEISKDMGMSISNFMMYSAFLNKKLNKDEKQELRALLIETRRIGNNLNQIARSLNYLALVEGNKLIISNETIIDVKFSINQIIKNQEDITYFISKIL